MNHDAIGLDTVALICSNKGALQKTPWTHDERTHGCYLKLMGAACIGSTLVPLKKSLGSVMTRLGRRMFRLRVSSLHSC